MMNSSKLNSRITITSHAGVELFSCWADVRPITTREQLRNGNVIANDMMTVMIRYRSGINTTLKMLYKGITYDIISITDSYKDDNIILTVVMNDDDNRIRTTP